MESSLRNVELNLNTALHTKVTRVTKSIPLHAQWKLFIISLILNDVVMIGLAFRAAFLVRFELSIPIFHIEVLPSIMYYRYLVLGIIPFWILIFGAMGLYNRQNLLGGTREYSRVFNGTTLGIVSIIAAGFLLEDLIFARGWVLLAWLFAFFAVAFGRFMLRRVVYYLRRHGFFLATTVIVGANQESYLLAEQLLGWKTSGLHVIGFVDDHITPGKVLFQDLYSLGNIEELPMILEVYKVDELVLATSALKREDMVKIFEQYGVSKKVNLRMSSGLYEIITTGIQVTEMASVPLVRVNKVRLTGVDSFLKWLLDYSITIPGLLLLSPFLLLIAFAIKLASPGPVIYRRRVMGVNGRQFDAYKFRTMYINGDDILASYPELQAELAANHKLKKDPRITPVGRFLRKTSLDELPQLVNVLKRDMSLVGPRMITPEEMSKYHQWYMNLLTVRPGITGLWQVSGRSDVSYEERVRLDMQYIRNWSIWSDLQLLVYTIPAVIKSRGAY